MITYADIFLKLKNSKFVLGFYGELTKTLFILPTDKGYKKEGYGNAIKTFLDSDHKNKEIYKDTNILPPGLTIDSIRWESGDDAFNNEIKEDIVKKTGLVVISEEKFPCGMTLYYQINLSKKIKIVFNDLVVPELDSRVTQYLDENNLSFEKGFFNPGHTHHTFDEKFHTKSQLPALIIDNRIEYEKIGYTDDFDYFDVESSTKAVIDNINHTKSIIKDLENLGMKCYIFYIGNANGTSILAHTNPNK